MELACSPHACVGRLQVFRLPPQTKDMSLQYGEIGSYKLASGVNVSLNGWLSLFALQWADDLSRMHPASCPKGDGKV